MTTLPQPNMYDFGRFGAGIKAWAEKLVEVLSVPDEGILKLTRRTLAQLPSAAASKGCMLIVTDETGGEVPAWSDGTNWRRVTDRAVVS